MRFAECKGFTTTSLKYHGLFYLVLLGIGKEITCGAFHWPGMLKNKKKEVKPW